MVETNFSPDTQEFQEFFQEHTKMCGKIQQSHAEGRPTTIAEDDFLEDLWMWWQLTKLPKEKKWKYLDSFQEEK